MVDLVCLLQPPDPSLVLSEDELKKRYEGLVGPEVDPSTLPSDNELEQRLAALNGQPDEESSLRERLDKLNQQSQDDNHAQIQPIQKSVPGKQQKNLHGKSLRKVC